MRFTGKLALKVGAVGVAAGAILSPLTAANAAPAPSITATPNTLLQNGQTISVTGANQAPSSTAFIVECSALTGSAACDTHNVVQAATDADGNIAATPFTVKTGPIGTAGGTCPPATPDQHCYLVATTDPLDPTDTAATSVTELDFAPVISATPATVKDGGTVKVAGYGFAPNKTVAVVSCASATDQSACDIANASISGTTDANGTFSNDALKVVSTAGGGKCKVGKTCFIVATTDIVGQGADKSQDALTTVTIKAGSSTGAAATKTSAKFSSKKDAIKGKVTSAGKGIKGLTTKLRLKKGGHWKTVDSTKTHKGGKFAYKHIKKSGTYDVKTIKTAKYKGSTSKSIKVKV